MGKALVQFNLDLLAKELNLPKSTKLLRVMPANLNWLPDSQMVVLVEDESLPETGELQAYPFVTLMFHSEYCEHCNHVRIASSEFLKP